ncbi:MAG: amino acid ABC transporter permease [Candidatus Thorarchaeota archaeon]
MFFQTDSKFTIDLIIGILIQFSIFFVGIYLMRWYAKEKNKRSSGFWDISLKTSLKVNLVWLVINLAVKIGLYFLFIEDFIIDLINTCINVLIGSAVVILAYKKTIRESIFFVIIIQLILLTTSLLLGLLILVIIGFFVDRNYEIIYFILVVGLPYTLLLTSLGLLIGFILGISLALMRVYGSVELSWFSNVYEKIFRGIPVLVLIYIFYFGLSDLFWFVHPVQKPLVSMVLALGLRSGAYQSQIFRGAILSVNPGQVDAAHALGMSGSQTFRHIIFPQAIRIAVPSWSNEYSVVIKDSSFAYAIGIVELTKAAYDYSYAFRGTWALSLGLLALLYFLLTFPVTKTFGGRQTKKLKELGMGGG